MSELFSQLTAAIAAVLIVIVVGVKADWWWAMVAVAVFLFASSFALYTSTRNDSTSKGR